MVLDMQFFCHSTCIPDSVSSDMKTNPATTPFVLLFTAVDTHSWHVAPQFYSLVLLCSSRQGKTGSKSHDVNQSAHINVLVFFSFYSSSFHTDFNELLALLCSQLCYCSI